MRTLFAFILMLFVCIGYAQKEANIWYFGKYAGLNFSSSEMLISSRVNVSEGITSICDQDGAILFYSDGNTVWNKNHKILLNGNGIKGNPSSTQTGVFLKSIENDSIYYLFTISNEGNPDGFCYSVINKNGDEGRGEVVQKNIQLAGPVSEKITVIRDRNQKDYWILTHKWNSDEFMVFRFTKNGIDTNYLSYKTGSVHTGDINNSMGYMKASADGTQLALAIKGENIVELFDFDDSTSKITNPVQIKLTDGALPYGIEFSCNGNLLYIGASGSQDIYQIDLQKPTKDEITKSLTIIGHSNNITGALQLGLDHKLYIAGFKAEYLDLIEFPDSVGLSCNFQNEALFLQGNLSNLGFPNFPAHYFQTKLENAKSTSYFNANLKIELGIPLIINNIVFENTNAIVSSKSCIELNKLVDFLKKNPKYLITLQAHTDNIGNKSANINLSQKRANAIAEYLITKGIQKERISTNGYGGAKPIVSNMSQEGRKQNNRVEMIINTDIGGNIIVKTIAN